MALDWRTLKVAIALKGRNPKRWLKILKFLVILPTMHDDYTCPLPGPQSPTR